MYKEHETHKSQQAKKSSEQWYASHLSWQDLLHSCKCHTWHQ